MMKPMSMIGVAVRSLCLLCLGVLCCVSKATGMARGAEHGVYLIDARRGTMIGSDAAGLLTTTVSYPRAVVGRSASAVVSPDSVVRGPITGRVLDDSRHPLSGASVRIVGTQIGAIADANGRFVIQPQHSSGRVAAQQVTLLVQYIGMVSQTVTWHGAELTVLLHEDTQLLSEVVVHARPNINDIDLRARSGVVELVDMRALQQKPMLDLSAALQGSVPGLTVVMRGEQGTKPEIRIRGNSSFRHGDAPNEPLYVLDGKVISSDAFLTLNPLDIRSIKVLKDAAATALYGVKAANGVVEISAQRGVPGPLSVSLTTQMGITLRGRRSVPMMQTTEKLELERRTKSLSTPGYILSPDYYETASISDLQALYGSRYGVPATTDRAVYARFADQELQRLRGVDTDWYQLLMRHSIYQSHSLALRGGDDRYSYYLSGNYARQGGQLPGHTTQRVGLSSSSDLQLGTGYLSLSLTGGYARTDTPNGSQSSPSTLIYELNPYESPETTSLYSYPGRGYSDLTNQYRRYSEDYRGGATLSVNLSPIPPLHVDGVVGLDFVLNDIEEVTPASSPLEAERGKPAFLRGAIAADRNTTLNVTTNLRATWHQTWGDHDLTLSANTDYYYTHSRMIHVVGHGIGRLEMLAGVNKAKGTIYAPDFSGHTDRVAQIGIGWSMGYTYKGMVDLFGAFKWDGSSLLLASRRWNSAMAAGAGVHLLPIIGYSDDRTLTWLTDLHLKGSWGRTASLGGISPSLAAPVFSYDTESYYADKFRVLRLQAMYNPTLRPEVVEGLDIGLELQLWRRYRIAMQAYRKDTQNALITTAIPSSNGLTSQLKNVGQLRNQGVELILSGLIIDRDRLQWSARTSLALNRSTVVDLYDTDAIYGDDDALFPEYEEGRPYDALYALDAIGIHPLTGEPMFRDKSGVEKPFYAQLTRDDFVHVGYTNPPIQGTIGSSLSCGDFDLDAQLYYVLGAHKAYPMTHVRDKSSVHKNAVAGQLDLTWFEPGDRDKLYPSPSSSRASYETMSRYPNTRMIARTDYLRLSMLSLRYRIPHQWLQATLPVLKYASVALQGSNLFTITPYRGANPEAGTFDIGVQPVWTLNLTLNL